MTGREEREKRRRGVTGREGEGEEEQKERPEFRTAITPLYSLYMSTSMSMCVAEYARCGRMRPMASTERTHGTHLGKMVSYPHGKTESPLTLILTPILILTPSVQRHMTHAPPRSPHQNEDEDGTKGTERQPAPVPESVPESVRPMLHAAVGQGGLGLCSDGKYRGSGRWWW